MIVGHIIKREFVKVIPKHEFYVLLGSRFRGNDTTFYEKVFGSSYDYFGIPLNATTGPVVSGGVSYWW